jgi:hypothetical protein
MLTDDEIKALLEGCEGVTPGPWRPDPWDRNEGNVCANDVYVAQCVFGKDIAHIARCDPTTIAELCTRLLSAEERMKAAEEQASKLRMCVNCGKYAPAGHPRHEPFPECVDPATGFSSCTFDMTPHEAWQHWSAKAHALQARVKVLEDALTEIADGKYSGYCLPTHPPQDPAVNRARTALQEQSK